MRHIKLALALSLAAQVAQAGVTGSFPSIDGGILNLEDWRGQPVLVVNTASQCGYTGQYADLQTLYETYRDRGLVVLAVPSDDFNQELDTAQDVKEFCEVTFGLTLPMTDILSVRGPGAHEFYQDVAAETGFVPAWNFNKVLIGPDGAVVATWGSRTKPMSRAITGEIELLLN
ncbi:MAG: glutathione peroxidase [Rhodobacteraceae bacterium]|nr:MAG: glutathione peroxidase [Paracoccaceae bacterium]